MKHRRNYVKRLPKPGGEPPEPDERFMHRCRRRQVPVPATAIEQPLKHFCPEEISARVDSALARFAKLREAVEHPEMETIVSKETQARERAERGKAQLPPSDRE